MLIEKLLQLHLNSGILLAVPIPEEEAVESKQKLNCHLASILTKGAHESYVRL